MPSTRSRTVTREFPSDSVPLVVQLAIRTTSHDGNAKGNWFKRQQAASDQRAAAKMMMNLYVGKPPVLPVTVLVTRIAPGRLDAHDNLPQSQKHVVDGIADWLGCDDGDESAVRWHYAQRKGGKGQYAVEIRIEPHPQPAEGTVGR